MDITFGTSGWRAIIAEGFTFNTVRLVAGAIADFIKNEKLHNRPVVVGYDRRFMSEDFAGVAAEVLAKNGLETQLCTRDTPTPVVAFSILKNKAGGAINITASHNPPEYSGIKFSSSWGGPALPGATRDIEERIKLLSERSESQLKTDAVPARTKAQIAREENIQKKLIVALDPRDAYLKQIDSLVDIKTIKKARLKVAVDMFHGTSWGYLDKILAGNVAKLKVINDNRDVLFDGRSPDPKLENTGPLLNSMKEIGAGIGLATDGDSDRYGIADSNGEILSANEVLAVLIDYLVRTRKWKGVVARSVVTSHLVDAVAKIHGLDVVELPVGFKYVGEVMAKESSIYPAKDGGFVIGGEESAGLTIRGHVPEKDGILACLLCCEVIAARKQSLKQIVANLQKEAGAFYFSRFDLRLTHESLNAARGKLSSNPPTEFAGFKVRRIVETDGHKFILSDGNWLACRLSGTEPVVRIYAEASSPDKLNTLMSEGKKWFEKIM